MAKIFTWKNGRKTGTTFEIYEGTGSPEGVITGNRGDLYVRTDGGTGTTLYIKETGTATNTGWAFVQSSAQPRYNGLEDGSKFSLSYNVSTRQLTVTYSSGAAVWVDGVRHAKSGSDVFTAHANTTGKYYFYYDSTGAIASGNTAWDIMSTAQLAVIYYNATTTAYVLLDERHPATTGMPEATHKYMHLTRGTQTVSGMAISGYTLSTAGASALSYTVASGVIADEDLFHTVNSLADGGPYRVLRLIGTGSGAWTWADTSTTGILDDGTNIYYNQNNAGTWQLTPVTVNNRWVNYFVFAMPEYSGTKQIVAVVGQTLHTSLASAQSEDPAVSIANISNLTDEGVYLYRLTYQRIGGNTPSNAQLVSVQGIRTNLVSVTGGFSTSSHASLSDRGLANQHPATSVATDTTNFNNNLSAADDTVQKALETIDNISGLAPTSFVQESFNGTGTDTDFTVVGFTFSATDALDVYMNGRTLVEGASDDFTRNYSLNKIVFASAPASNARVLVRKWA